MTLHGYDIFTPLMISFNKFCTGRQPSFKSGVYKGIHRDIIGVDYLSEIWHVFSRDFFLHHYLISSTLQNGGFFVSFLFSLLYSPFFSSCFACWAWIERLGRGACFIC